MCEFNFFLLNLIELNLFDRSNKQIQKKNRKNFCLFVGQGVFVLFRFIRKITIKTEKNLEKKN